MTDQPAEATRTPEPPPVEAARHQPALIAGLLPGLIGGALGAVAIGVVAYWLHPASPDLAATQQQLARIETRLTQLEQRPVPGAAVDVTPLTTRIDRLERRPVTDLGPVLDRLGALEHRPPSDVEALNTRLATLEQASASGIRLAQAQAAAAALAAGRPLGQIPGATPALARFATAAPPTEAGLRLAYPAAERAALLASRPDQPDQPFLTRILARAQALITIRQGDDVLIGDPAAGILARARRALDAGDLDGAVAALGDLHGPAATAMADWVAQAAALAEARRAVAELATRR